eukprot:366061-Chlamydomonas_euryale.AAC.7
MASTEQPSRALTSSICRALHGKCGGRGLGTAEGRDRRSASASAERCTESVEEGGWGQLRDGTGAHQQHLQKKGVLQRKCGDRGLGTEEGGKGSPAAPAESHTASVESESQCVHVLTHMKRWTVGWTWQGRSKHMSKRTFCHAQPILRDFQTEVARFQGGQLRPCVKRWDGRATGKAVGWATGKAVGWATGKAVGWATGKAVGWATGKAVGWGTGKAVGWGTGSAVGWRVTVVVGMRAWQAGRTTQTLAPLPHPPPVDRHVPPVSYMEGKRRLRE